MEKKSKPNSNKDQALPPPKSPSPSSAPNTITITPPPPPPPPNAKSGGGSGVTGSGQGRKPSGHQQQQNQQQQRPRCQVEGCEVDLSDAKAYYSRHKVCGMHSKSPVVIVAGSEKRFCQQCSRFHQLSEFDQGKRSCRRRLAGHNERRRKPPPGSLVPSRYGRLYTTISENSSRAGGFVMDFGAYARHSGREPWQSSRSSEQSIQPWPSSAHNPPPGAANLYGLQGPGGSGSGFQTGHGIPSGECYTGVSIADSNCALSLLSNQWGSRSQAPSTIVVNNLAPHGSGVVQYQNPSGDGSSSLEMCPDLALGQIPPSQPVGAQFCGDLQLSQQNSGQYAAELENSQGFRSPTQHMNWSL